MSDYLPPERDQGEPDGYQPPDSYQTPDHYHQSSPGSYDPRGYHQPTERPKHHRRGWSRTVVGVVCAVLGFLAGLALMPAVHAIDGAGNPDTLTVSGTLTLTSISGIYSDDDKSCTGKEGYDDVHSGSQVSVKDGAGKTLAFTKLSGDGKVTSTYSGFPDACQWRFTVTGVPAGEPVYTLGIGSRSGPSYHEAGLAKTVALTLG
jgi:type II secretory pathway pseudopilin PulG